MKENHAAALAQRDAEHEIERSVLHDTLDQLEGILDAAVVRAKKSSEASKKVKVRGQTARSTVAERWRTKVKAMKEAWKLAAYQDVKSAHSEAVAQLKKLESAAHASKRDALERAEKATAKFATNKVELVEQQQLARRPVAAPHRRVR
eukprot:3741549-Pleurochrysis_carterae.AAC.5